MWAPTRQGHLCPFTAVFPKAQLNRLRKWVKEWMECHIFIYSFHQHFFPNYILKYKLQEFWQPRYRIIPSSPQNSLMPLCSQLLPLTPSNHWSVFCPYSFTFSRMSSKWYIRCSLCVYHQHLSLVPSTVEQIKINHEMIFVECEGPLSKQIHLIAALFLNIQFRLCFLATTMWQVNSSVQCCLHFSVKETRMFQEVKNPIQVNVAGL